MVFDEADTLCDSWPDLDKTLYAISWEKNTIASRVAHFVKALLKVC